MKVVIKPTLVTLGLALMVGALLMTSVRQTSGAFDGIVEFKNDTSTSATDIVFATNDTSTDASIIAVHVRDGDLPANVGGPTTTVLARAGGESVVVTITFLTSSPTSTYSGAMRLSTVTSATGTIPTLNAAHGQTVTAEYTDTTVTTGGSITIVDTLEVDAVAPTFQNLTPADGAITNDTTPGYSVVVKDVDSGVDESFNSLTQKLTLAAFLIASGGGASTTVGATAFGPLTADVSDFLEDATKVGITMTMNLDFVGGAGGIVWVGARAQDKAGNTATYDVDPASSQDLNKVVIDVTKPVFDEVYTGIGWNAIDQAFETNKKNKLIVIFDDDLTNLDPTSVNPSDFQVTNPARSVIAADWYDSDTVTTSVTGLTAASWGAVRRSVFLTLSTDLASSDTPNVKLIGSGVADEAGNMQDSGNKDAMDRIAPTITVSNINPAVAGKDATVTFGIAADEPLNVTPAVTITNLGIGTTLGKSLFATGTNAWEVTTSALSTNGTYSVYVTGGDPAANQNTAGAPGIATSTLNAPGFLGFEADIALSRPRLAPVDGSALFLDGPLAVVIDFTDTTEPGGRPEDDEYFGDSHGTVTLTTAMLDGDDILSSLSTSDNKTFIGSIVGVGAGAHTSTGSAMDEAGNSTNFTSTFTLSIKVPGPNPWGLAALAALFGAGLALLLSGRVRRSAT